MNNLDSVYVDAGFALTARKWGRVKELLEGLDPKDQTEVYNRLEINIGGTLLAEFHVYTNYPQQKPTKRRSSKK